MATESRKNEIHLGQTWVRSIINNGNAAAASATYSFVAGLPIHALQTALVRDITKNETFSKVMLAMYKGILKGAENQATKAFRKDLVSQMVTQGARGLGKTIIFYNMGWFKKYGDYQKYAIIAAYVGIDAFVYPINTRIVRSIEGNPMPPLKKYFKGTRGAKDLFHKTHQLAIEHYKGIGSHSLRTALTCWAYLQLYEPCNRLTAKLGLPLDSLSAPIVTTVPISAGIVAVTQPFNVIGTLEQSGAGDKDKPPIANNRYGIFNKSINAIKRKIQLARLYTQREGLRAMWRGGLSNIGITYLLALNTTLLIYYGQKEDDNGPILDGEDPKPYLPL